MVGAACAASMAKLDVTKKKKILLLESAPKRIIEVKPEYSNRVVALNPSSVSLLEKVGAWGTIARHRYNPVYRMKVWEACSDASISFEDPGGQPLSYLVENDLVQKALNAVLEDCSNLTVIYGRKVEKYCLPEDVNENLPETNVKIVLDNGDTVETKLLIGADGNRSLVRETLGCDSMNWEYKSMGVVGTLELAEGTENHTAFQRFLPTGPVAILPLSRKHSSLVWSLPTNQAKEKMSLSEEDFIADLERSIWDGSNKNELVNTAALGLDVLLKSFVGEKQHSELPHRIKGVKGRAGFPLGFIHSTRYVGPRTVLIGDAAHRVHPLAGQGVNLGFGDVETLTDVIRECLRDGAGLGNRSYLLQYESSRQRHNLPTMFSIDSLQKLYSSTFTPVVLARTLGLQITDSLTPLKKLLISHAAA